MQEESPKLPEEVRRASDEPGPTEEWIINKGRASDKIYIYHRCEETSDIGCIRCNKVYSHYVPITNQFLEEGQCPHCKTEIPERYLKKVIIIRHLQRLKHGK